MLPTDIKITADVTSAGIILGTLTDHLPIAAAALSVIWALIRIAETESFQLLLGRKRWMKREPKDEGSSEDR